MLVSYKWLQNYVDLKDPAETVLNRLIHAGIAVENVKHLGQGITQVVVAELLSVEKHPQADRLSLTKVTDGKETYQVVCGAKNIAVGQRVPLAKVGAVLPGNFEIKAAKIRGIESFGMLCSAKELGLAEDAEGIFILPSDAPLGENFLHYMGLPDTLFDLEITPNRADLLSHLGVAREAAALYHKPVKFPKVNKIKESQKPVAKSVHVSIEAKDLCHLYTCRVIEGVQVGPSPRWLVEALGKMGQRSINNIVDVTNYVLLEMGQPLHAFDLDQIQGSKIIVRRAKAGENLPLLDNTERELKEDMLVIADADRPVALAGIMGGSNSQVTGTTLNILLESALFLPGSVRKTARQLSISTDSSYRFERGVDPQAVAAALERAASLIQEVAGGIAAKGVSSTSTKTIKPVTINFRPARANALLGLELAPAAQVKILKDLGCKITGSKSAKSLKVTGPSFRLDLLQEIDLVEEIARITGYDRIPVTPPAISSSLFDQKTPVPFEADIRSCFHRSGFYEAVNSSFLAADFSKKLKLAEGQPLRDAVEVSNPIADDQRVLRPTLLSSLLANTQANLAHQQETIRLYELNKVFAPAADGGVRERYQAAAVWAGSNGAPAWHSPERKADYYDIKGLAEGLLDLCRVEGAAWEFGSGSAPYHSTQSFRIKNASGDLMVWGGLLSPKVLKEHDISTSCQALEIDLETLGRSTVKPLSFTPLPKFPSAWRDIAVVVPDGVTSGQVLAAIEEQGKPELKQVLLFDLYRGTNLPPGVRSLAYRLHFQNEDRTLTDQEVTNKVTLILEHLKTRYAIALR